MKTIKFEDRAHYINKLDHRSIVMFSLRCAKSVKQTKHGLACVEAVEKWLKADSIESKSAAAHAAAHAAADVAAYVADAAAHSAAYAAHAAYAAANAANAAVSSSIKEQLMHYLWELVNIDEVFEKVCIDDSIERTV
jgi:hypothetical protein